MKYIAFFIAGFLLLIGCQEKTTTTESTTNPAKSAMDKQKQLRHVVMFKFKEDADPAEVKKVEDAFAALPSQISEISFFEWGLNNSTEGLNKGFTHCFFMSFDSEEARQKYLPHPDHQAFVGMLDPLVKDALVVDYWN